MFPSKVEKVGQGRGKLQVGVKCCRRDMYCPASLYEAEGFAACNSLCSSSQTGGTRGFIFDVTISAVKNEENRLTNVYFVMTGVISS